MRIRLSAKYRNNIKVKLLVTPPETIPVESLVVLTGNIVISKLQQHISQPKFGYAKAEFLFLYLPCCISFISK